MLMPPDAEPVIPARTFTDTATVTTGLPLSPRTALRTMVNAGRDAITAPNPTSLAVFRMDDMGPWCPGSGNSSRQRAAAR